MPIFKVHQVATHPMFPGEAGERISHVIGKDLGHAIDCVKFGTAALTPIQIEAIKRDLRKKYHSIALDKFGRTLHIEIIEEVKA